MSSEPSPNHEPRLAFAGSGVAIAGVLFAVGGVLGWLSWHTTVTYADSPHFSSIRLPDWSLHLTWGLWLLLVVAFARSRNLWLSRSLSWSTSPESWRERYVSWSILAAAALLGLLSLGVALGWSWPGGPPMRVPFWLLGSLWTVWLITALVLMRLGHLNLLGPVLFYDMIRSARRSRSFLLRGAYAVVLLLILFFVWMTVPAFNISARDRASRMAMDYFEMFTVVQLVAIALLTPAYVAGAISEEKDRKTLEFLLATDLRNREIVLSKLLSRLAHLSLFLLTGLPILSLLQFLGGIDPNLVFASFAFTMITMVGIGGVSILNSVLYKRPRDSIAISYLFLIAYMFLTTLLFQYQPPAVLGVVFGMGSGTGTWEGQLIEFTYTGNIFVLIAKVYMSGSRGTLAADLPALLGEYALFYGLIAGACILWAIVRLRRIALKQTFASVKLSQQGKDRPPVGELPMLWKEVHVEGSLKLNWMAWILVLLLVLATFANPFVWVVEWTFIGGGWSTRDVSREMNIWVRIAGTAIACLTILGVAIRAANSIGNERDKQTMDGLLSSPLNSTEILGAKFLGSLCSVRLGWIWMAGVYIIALVTGGIHLFAFPLVLTAWFVYSSVAAMIGLGYSMACGTTLRATVYTVLTCALLGAGHWLIWFCCGPILFFSGASGDGAFYLVKFQAGITPPIALGMLSFCGDDVGPESGDQEMIELIAFSIFGMFLWALGGLFFWNGVLVPRFRAFTGRIEEIDVGAAKAVPPALPPVHADDSSVV